MRAILFLVFCILSAPVFAQAPSDLARAGLVPGWRDDATHVAGLTLQVAPGWHTYWRAPGDAGIPPSFNWSGSRNLAHVEVRYPVPEVYHANGTRSIVYHDQVTFPLIVTPRDPSKPVRLRGEIDIGVCEEICVPVRLEVRGNLPAPGRRDAALAAALKDRPRAAGAMTCDIAPIADGLRVTLRSDLAPLAGDEVAVVEAGSGEIWVSPADLTRKGRALTAVVEMVAPSGKPFALARSDLRMTLFAAGRAVELRGCL
ncbi:MAG: protein-disulfide reductase DsbD family protein [Silicimonas sp.]|nr:protein-disulfide reductase DsbD family protein [Silicimonas sp.]